MTLLGRLGFDRLKASLSKTRESLTNQLAQLVRGKTRVDAETLEHLEEILIRADVGLDASLAIIDRVKERALKQRSDEGNDLTFLLKESLLSLLLTENKTSTNQPNSFDGAPGVILMVGVNGVGKTTTIGKLSAYYRNQGKRVLIAAADTFRAAANEQLEIWADRSGAELLKQEHGADPAAVAFDALRSARSCGKDVLIIDTAGRLHTRVNLMEELKKIRRVLQKVDPSAPHEVLLVLDASTGQNGLQQARQFAVAVGVTGIVLTKLDGTARGGIVFAIASELRLPVRFVGIGEGIGDLEEFDPNAFVNALFAGSEGERVT
jgi:fused signal recognition particle receptor